MTGLLLAALLATGLSGTVTDTEGNGLARIVVTVTRDGQAAATAESAADGDWEAEVPEGTYTVDFADPQGRYEPRTYDRAVRVAPGAVTSGIDATLRLRTLPVEVVAGANRVATALAASRRGFPDGAEAVVVASAWSFPDALAAAPLAAHEGGPLILVDRRVGDDVLAELARLGPRRATIVGAVAAVSATVQDELRRAGLDVRRIAGDGRYDTAALVAAEVGPASSGEVIVASGEDFADAMSAAPLAAAEGIPIILTAQDALPADTRAVLDVLRPRRALVVGGAAAVADTVLEALPDPERIAGPDRHATSVAVARVVLARGGSLSEVAVASGTNYPDGLASAPAVAAHRAPLLLAHPDPHHGRAVYDFLDARLGEVGGVTVYGGPAALGADVLGALARPYEAAR